MPEISSNSKRIAKNTVVLYVRMFLLMLVSLFNSRITLQVLGVDDYGIYNVVAGFVGMMAFFNATISNASQRYLSIGLGRGDDDAISAAFRQSRTLLIIFTIAMVLVAETGGVWFVKNKLIIPENRLPSAICVFHLAVFMMVCSILQVTYNAAIIAHERMGIYAYLAIFEALAKLSICFVLLFSKGDHLIVYASLMALVSLFTLFFYISYCKKSFNEFSMRFIWDKCLVRDMSKFIGSNIYGSLAYVGGIEGANVLMNMHFGPVVNASRAISNQVSLLITRFVDNAMMTAVKPQIIKSYSSGDTGYSFRLINESTKFSFFACCYIAVPIIFETEYILKLWLGTVPEYAVVFTRIQLAFVVAGVLATPLWAAACATGNLKRNQVYGRTITLLSLPLSYFALQIWHFPVTVMVIVALMAVAYWFYCIYDVYVQINMNLGVYFKKAVFPGLIVMTWMAFTGVILTLLLHCSDFVMLFVRGGGVLLAGVSSSYALLDKPEKAMLKSFVSRKRKMI